MYVYISTCIQCRSINVTTWEIQLNDIHISTCTCTTYVHVHVHLQVHVDLHHVQYYKYMWIYLYNTTILQVHMYIVHLQVHA